MKFSVLGTGLVVLGLLAGFGRAAPVDATLDLDPRGAEMLGLDPRDLEALALDTRGTRSYRFGVGKTTCPQSLWNLLTAVEKKYLDTEKKLQGMNWRRWTPVPHIWWLEEARKRCKNGPDRPAPACGKAATKKVAC